MITRRSGMLILAAVALAPAIARAQSPGQPPLPPPIDNLTSLALQTTDGAATTLGQHLRAGPTVITFWATWCSPCIAEGRQLARVRERVPVEQLNIIGINMDRDRDPARLQRFMQRGRMNYTQLNGTVSAYRAFGNQGAGAQILLPRLYVFAADGRPTAAFGRYDGAASLREIERAVDAVLA